jgi:glutathione S-transferase
VPQTHFYGVNYSPWTERARWALDHHAIAYRYHEHVPFLGERLLRFRGRHTGKKKVTAPLLTDRSTAYGDSFEIIAWSDRRGSSAGLIDDHDAARDWCDRIELGLAASRARTTGRILRDPEALNESAMAVSPALFAPLLRPIAAQGAKYVGRKYGANLDDESAHEQAMTELLDEIRSALGGRASLHGNGFGAKDILAATFMQGVAPVAERYIALRPALRRAWTCEQLAREYADLVEWRDTLYAKHRKAR